MPRLQPINIPIFSGDYEAWNTFSDLFTNVIIRNDRITGVQKMQHLKTRLVGAPAQIIGHLHISEDNFTVAWESLKNRYENKRLLVSKYMNLIIDQPTSVGDSAESLKNLYDKTKEGVNALKNLGITSETGGLEIFIAHLLIKKMDKETYTWYEQGIGDTKEVQSLNVEFKFLQKRFQTLEAIGGSNKANTKSEKQAKVLNSTTQKECSVL